MFRYEVTNHIVMDRQHLQDEVDVSRVLVLVEEPDNVVPMIVAALCPMTSELLAPALMR